MKALMLVIYTSHGMSVSTTWFSSHDACVLAQPSVRAAITLELNWLQNGPTVRCISVPQ